MGPSVHGPVPTRVLRHAPCVASSCPPPTSPLCARAPSHAHAPSLEELSDQAAAAFTRDQLVQQRIRSLLGTALRAMGVVRFLEVVPLRVATVPPPGGVFPGVDDDRLWILRLLRCAARLRVARAPRGCGEPCELRGLALGEGRAARERPGSCLSACMCD